MERKTTVQMSTIIHDLHLPLARADEIVALKEVAKSLSAYHDVLKVVVFGSRVRGDFTGDSDMDVLVVISKADLDLENKVVHALGELEFKYDVPLSPVIFTKREYDVNKNMGSPFITNVEREGIVLYAFE